MISRIWLPWVSPFLKLVLRQLCNAFLDLAEDVLMREQASNCKRRTGRIPVASCLAHCNIRLDTIWRDNNWKQESK